MNKGGKLLKKLYCFVSGKMVDENLALSTELIMFFRNNKIQLDSEAQGTKIKKNERLFESASNALYRRQELPHYPPYP